VRTITIMAAVSLVAAAGVSQKAIDAPRPSGTPKSKGGLVEQVACVSATDCAGLGVWQYSDLAGKWKAGKVPVVAGTGGTNLRSLDCPAAGNCEAVGDGGLQHVVQVSENGRQWTAGELELPADAASVKPPIGPLPSLDSVSCASVGNCVAVGGYTGSDRTLHPLLFAQHSGTWGTGTEPQLPSNAATSYDPNQPGVGGRLSLVSCPSAGNCTAVGIYSNKSAGESDYPWVATETGGSWKPGSEAQLPAGAALYGDLTVGDSPFFGFTGLSCPSAGNCTAVGGYDKQGSEEGLILAEKNGVWSRAAKAPLPRHAFPNSEPNEFTTPLASVSCAAANDCAAVGWYVVHVSGTFHGLLLGERNGAWKASALVLPAGARAPGGVFLTSVACPSRGNCLAVGYYADQGKTHGLVVRERGGKWERAVNAALPNGAAPASKAHTFLNSVSCPTASACTAGGYYADRSGVTQGLLLSLRLR
jgi:hypothetical protein